MHTKFVLDLVKNVAYPTLAARAARLQDMVKLMDTLAKALLSWGRKFESAREGAGTGDHLEGFGRGQGRAGQKLRPQLQLPMFGYG